MSNGSGSHSKTLRLLVQGPGAVERAVELLQHGEAVAFPTDTVYGLGVQALTPGAVSQLYTIKGRPLSLPIPLLLADPEDVEAVCVDIHPAALQLAGRFWPGALSLVLHRAPHLPGEITAGGPTVAVRVADHALVRELCRRLGAPLATTSANLHGQPDPVSAAQVESALEGRIPLILDGGTCPGGVASTVLDLTVWPPAILRPGPVTAEQLETVVPLRI